MKNNIFCLILGFLLLSVLGLFIFSKSTHAMLLDGGGGSGFGSTINITAFNSGTTWRTRVDYKPYGGQTTTYMGYSGSSIDVGQNMQSNDTITWYTACVDPESNVTTSINVSCRSYDAASTTNCQNIMNAENPITCGVAYGACGGPNDYPSAGSSSTYSLYARNLGTVAYSLCPIPNDNPGRDSQSGENKFRCAYKGYVTGVGYVGCRNTCTYRYCGGSGSNSSPSVYWLSTPYSSNCFSGNTCAPPPPTITSTPSCVNNAASISTTWSTVSYSNGVDDFRYKRSTDFTWITDLDAPEPKVVSGLSDNTVYNIQVRSHTTSGHAGPTDWASVNVTTGTCSRPNLVVSAFTFPNGYVGAAGNASVTVTNNGGQSTGTSFNVSVRDGVTSTVRTSTTTALGAGASRALSIPVTLPPTAGTYTAVATADSASQITESNEADNTRTDSYTATANALTVHVYNDFNGNGVEDAVDTDASGRTVTITGLGAGTFTTNTSGNVVRSNLSAGSSTITVAVPSGWTSTTTNPRTATLPPSQTVNFGIRPPAPTCTSLTANPTSVAPGGTSTLTCNSPTSPTGDPITYTYFNDSSIAGDSVTNNNTNTSTWTAPNPYWIQEVANPSVSVCNPGGVCNNYQTSITIIPRFSISGNVFVDANKDAIKNAGESNYTSGTSTINIRTSSCGGPLVQSINSANGVFTTGANLAGGTYFVCYTTLPVGYQSTVPVNGPPPSFSVTVGNASTGGTCAPGSYCDANGNITNLNFGITNSIPWIQTTGGDVYITSGSQIPADNPTCGPYMSLQGNGGTPGVIYCGSATCNFGAGQASQNPYNWQVGGSTYPEVFTPKNAELKTSYNSLLSAAQRSGITPTPLGSSQCGVGGIASCVLTAGLANGVYIANGNLTLTGASYTLGANRDIVILVNGDLNINTEFHVPIGSTALFTTSGNINVASSVGETTTTSTRANVEGYYSTDRSFYVLGLSACPTSDRRLNVAGSVVVNAAFTGGSLIYERDLCADNLQCPVFMVLERPDFILNAPDFFKSTRRIWQEIAP